MRNCSHPEIFPDYKSSKPKTSWYSIRKCLLHWKKDRCDSYTDVVANLSDQDERRRKSLKASMREASTCLKARPMKRVRDFQKRKFGVVPVLVRFSASSRSLEKKSETV